jgi:hypothetical protein
MSILGAAAASLNVTGSGYPVNMAVTNSMSGGMMIFLLLMVFGGIALVLLISSLDRFTAFFKTFDRLINSIRYTACGTGIVAALYGIYLACVFLAQLGSGINPVHIGLGITAYTGVTVLGYGAVKVAGRFRKMHELYKKQEGIEEPIVSEAS